MIGRHGMMGEVADGHLLRLFSLFRNWMIHAPLQLGPDLLQLSASVVASTFPPDLKPAMPILSTEVRGARKLTYPVSQARLLARERREAAKRNQSGLVRMKLQRKLLQPFPHHIPETPDDGFVLEAHDIVRILAECLDRKILRGSAPPAHRINLQHFRPCIGQRIAYMR